MITVFTPTFNRGYIIEKLYYSLKRQSFRDFEWIVIDDGSTDNTEELFQKILKEKNDFSIVYKKTANGGKHRAINQGVMLARGELFFIVDSDDYLPDEALDRIVKVEQSIPDSEKHRFGGVCGMKGKTGKEYIGTTFSGDILDITTLERAQNHISGDKAEVFYTEILKKYPFPEFEGEKFISECVVWDRIAFDGYKLRFFNDIVYICDYLPDGLTAHQQEIYAKSPKGWGLYVAQSVKYGKLIGMKKWNEYLNYFYTYKLTKPFQEIADNLQVNPFKLYLRLLGMRIFYKLYQ